MAKSAKKTTSVDSQPQTKKAEKTEKSQQQKPSIIAENTTFVLSIPWEEVQKGWAKALQWAQSQIKHDGFRRGKVPLRLVEQTVDRQHLIQRTIEEIVPPAYQAYITEHNLIPLTEPDIHAKAVEQNQAWEFTVAIAQRPELDMTGYEKIVQKIKKDSKLWKDGGKEKTEKMTADQKKDAQVGELVSQLLEKIHVPVPELLLRRETEYQLHRLEHELEHMQMSLEDFLKNSGKKVEEIQQEYAARALGNLQVELLLGSIIRSQKIKVEAKEVAEALKQRHAEHDHKHTHEHSPEENEHHDHDHEHHHDHDHQVSSDEVNYVQSVLLKQKALDHLLGL